MKSLFKFSDEQNITTTEGEPIKGGASILKPETSLVNVVDDFSWTVQPKSSRKDVPYIYLIERKLTNDVMIQQLLYTLTATTQSGLLLTDELRNNIVKALGEDGIESSSQSATQDFIERFNNEETNASGIVDPLQPYAGLYSLQDTGWVYLLPYFSDKHHGVTSNWGTEGKGIISELTNTLTGALENVDDNVNRVITGLGALSNNVAGVGIEPRLGTYIERAKQYQFPTEGASYEVSFNLYNTTNISDVIQNWELCFIMLYNLLPNRRTKSIFDPPPLYEVHIPGVRRSPASYISSIDVSFMGATRLMDLQVGGQDKLRTIVPDAYKVTLSIQDVFPESKNFMESVINTEKRVKVSLETETTNTVSRSVERNVEANANEITHITISPTQRNGTIPNSIDSPSDVFGNTEISETQKRVGKGINKLKRNISRLSRGGSI